MFLTLLFLTTWTLFGLTCSRIAKVKGRNPTTWFYLGFFLGLIAVLIILFLPAVKKEVAFSADRMFDQPPQILTPNLQIEDNKIKELREKHWYFLDKNHDQEGPMTFDAFKKSFEDGKFSLENYIWNEDLEEWKFLKDVQEYHEHLGIDLLETQKT